ncbi:MAG: hypothetical protein R3F62_06235 [Planctomycetota bacterium]
MTRTALRLAPLALCCALVAQAQDAEESPTEVLANAPLPGLEYFPLDRGRSWTYQTKLTVKELNAAEEPTPQTHRVEVVVAEPQRIDEKAVSVVEWKFDGALAQRSFFWCTPDEVQCLRRIQGFGLEMRDFVLTDGQPVCRQPLAVGQSWTWSGRVNAIKGEQKVQVSREETLETPAGSFDCLVVEIEFTGEDDSKGTITRWLAKGVGIVKDVSTLKTAAVEVRSEGVLVRHGK